MRIVVLVLAAAMVPSGVTSLRTGEYLSSSYMARIKETRSPLAAGQVGSMTLYQVQRKGRETEFCAIHYFHYAGKVFRLAAGGSVRALEPGGTVAPLITLTQPQTFTVRWPKESKAEIPADAEDGDYTWVGDAARWVAQQCLVGTWVTSTGTSVSFAGNGWMRSPDGRRQYTMGLDHVMTDFDYIYGKGYLYGFRFDSGSLLLFETFEDASRIDQMRPEPKWVLRRVK